MKVIIFSPNYTTGISAASRKIEQIIHFHNLIQDEVVFFSPCVPLSSEINKYVCLPLRQRWKVPLIWNVFMILKLSFLCITSNRNILIISDFNPFFNFGFRNSIHLIHHLNDVPSLSFLEKLNAFFDYSSYSLFWFVWKIYLYLSPRNIMTVSVSVKKSILEASPSKYVGVVYNSIDAVSFMQPKITPVRIFNKIVMVGHNNPRKNYFLAIKVLSILYEFLHSDLQVVIIGDNVFELPRQLIFPNCENFITLKSSISQSDLITEYLTSSLFFSASLIEGFCLPYIEAQLNGCYTFTPQTDVFVELGFSNNFFFPLEQDARSIAMSAKLVLSKSNQINTKNVNDIPLFLSFDQIFFDYKKYLFNVGIL